jgi:hypothetical protein
MDFVYLILSVFLRLSPAVRKLSPVMTEEQNRPSDWVELAFLIPLVGWVSVSVQHRFNARWLSRRVRQLNEFHWLSLLSSCEEPGWDRQSFQREPSVPLLFLPDWVQRIFRDRY